MNIITDFDPSLSTSGVIHTLGVNPDEQLVLYNDSIYGLILRFSDGSIDIIPPSWNKSFIVKSVPMGDVKWSLFLTLTANNYPAKRVYGALYEPSEHVNDVNSGMQRGMIVTGGSVNVIGQIAQSIQDFNRTAGSLTIEATALGVLGDTVFIDNLGNMQLGRVGSGNPGSIVINGTGGNGLRVDSGGSFALSQTTIDPSTGQISTSAAINGSQYQISGVLVLSKGSDTEMFAPGQANFIRFTIPVTGTVAHVDSSGLHVDIGKLFLPTGSLFKISKFTAALTITPTFFNHGLGDIPDIVLMVPNGAAATSTRTFEWDSSTVTTTQVKLTGGSTFNADCVAIKF